MAHSSSNSNYKVVPEAADALNKFKYEVASEVGVNLKDGYNGDISAETLVELVETWLRS